MDAKSFAKLFLDFQDQGEAEVAVSPAQWTIYITKRMLEIANKAEPKLHLCAESLGSFGGHDEQCHQAKEWLFDFTFYKDEGWNGWGLPLVVVEHENQDRGNSFHQDLWKVLASFAPLRVMIGYRPQRTAIDGLVASLKQESEASHWRYPADSEDLILIGYRRMDVGDWRVVHRPKGATLSDAFDGSIKDFLSGSPRR